MLILCHRAYIRHNSDATESQMFFPESGLYGQLSFALLTNNVNKSGEHLVTHYRGASLITRAQLRQKTAATCEASRERERQMNIHYKF